MRNVDELIDEALDAEERALLRSIGDKPGLIEHAMNMFGAGMGWTIAVMMVMQTLMFLAGAYAGWQFFEATDTVTQLRWGLPSAVLVLMALSVKLAVAPAIHTDRLMRELKRIELQLARARVRGD